MKDFFYAIQDLFVDFLFLPFDALREIAYDSWFLSNIVSWVLMLIGFVAFIYWMLELRKFDKSGEEDKSITSHSYL
ncbi:MAG: uracil phosphoribosyltransferase [Bacteroidia bacterium]|nr:uracil phosphoribosyltransferase [Bacteroidia bacterium]NND10440.1 uracil phosphoribosyltransferase [Flavobacteriaceae bacterium]MBT8309534.1 uracil phosphoribosyltransferase [Bacteroidia bacterium]NNK27400.1 uracil phosphoribosyltransferase [Flavobacteriaceae bacterium]NNL59997.1 uracil phosphoribosyltransferase [Flavobacteriaceae bacterium]